MGKGNQIPIVDLVVADMWKRKELGISRYGSPLTGEFDGRDSLQEAYEEALDFCIYLKWKLEQERISRGE